MCCYGILLKAKSYMGAKENQSNSQRKEKCLVDVIVCLQPPTSYNTELDSENEAGRNTILHFSCFPPFPLETVHLEWADACSHPSCTLITMRLTWSSHPSRLLSSTCLPSAPVQATVPQFIQQQPWPFSSSVALSPRAAGLSSDPLTCCLWQRGHWQGSTVLNFRQGDINLARPLGAGPAPGPFFSLRIQ